MRHDSQELADVLDVMLDFQNGADVEVRRLGLYCDEADFPSSPWMPTSDPLFDWNRCEYRVFAKQRSQNDYNRSDSETALATQEQE